MTSQRRWRSETLEAVRTDSTKVVRDAEGRVTAYRLDGMTEIPVPGSPLTERLLFELETLHAGTAALPPSTLLPLPPEVGVRLRSLGYIR